MGCIGSRFDSKFNVRLNRHLDRPPPMSQRRSRTDGVKLLAKRSMRLPLWVVPVAKLMITAVVVTGIYVGRQVFAPVVLPDVNPAVSVRSHCPPPEARGFYFWFDTFAGRTADRKS